MRHVFFSFHYDDVWRANQVRNMWAVNKGFTRFTDVAAFEKVKQQGEKSIKTWIDRQMHGTSVTVVLIGTRTLNRQFVKYEIEQSIQRRNGLLGIHINRLMIRGNKVRTERPSNNLDRYNPNLSLIQRIITPKKYETKSCSESPVTHPTDYYNWVRDNIGDWVEEAARRARH